MTTQAPHVLVENGGFSPRQASEGYERGVPRGIPDREIVFVIDICSHLSPLFPRGHRAVTGISLLDLSLERGSIFDLLALAVEEHLNITESTRKGVAEEQKTRGVVEEEQNPA